MLPDYEKLGAFYLGKNKADNSLLLYDSSDLVTHAVCVGMTGSIALLAGAVVYVWTGNPLSREQGGEQGDRVGMQHFRHHRLPPRPTGGQEFRNRRVGNG